MCTSLYELSFEGAVKCTKMVSEIAKIFLGVCSDIFLEISNLSNEDGNEVVNCAGI